VVFFEVDGDCGWVGSGTLILDGSYVLTNWHVSGGGECPIRVGLTEDFATPPRDFYRAEVVVWDSQIDLAIVRLFDAAGSPLVPPGRQAIPFASGEARLGDEVRLIGYPVLREEFEDGARYTLTLTEGVVSGTEDFGTRSSYDPTDSRYYDYEVWGEYIKHTAEQNGGVSGGAAFNTRGELVAIPTAGRSADNPDNLPRLELMRSIRFAKELVERIK
jgi:S1-C subfamily serine protease